MRKRWMLASVAVMVAGLLALGPTALASKQQVWLGHIDKQHTLLFTTEKIGGVLNFEPDFINFAVTCQFSGDVIEWGAFFSGFEVPVDKHGNFDLNLGDPYYGPMDWAGTISGNTASGTILGGFPLYDGDGSLNTQSCDNAPGAAWTAKGYGGKFMGRPHTQMTIRFTKDKQGHVHVDVQR